MALFKASCFYIGRKNIFYGEMERKGGFMGMNGMDIPDT
jgi:hypothetical protein